MRFRLVLASTIFALAVVLAIASEGEAQKPPKAGAVSLKAGADQVTFSNPVALTGKVKGAKAGIVVTLERRAADETAFAPAGTATTDAKGAFAFAQRPEDSSVFRVTAASTPPA